MTEPKTPVVSPFGIDSPEGFNRSFKVKLMPGFSHAFFRLARRFAVEAQADPVGIELPMASVILASTALESFVNEEIEHASSTDPTIAAALRALHQDRRTPFRLKWCRVLQIQFGKTFKKRRDPFESIDLLAELRNVLVHRAARFRPVEDFPDESVKGLGRKYPFSPDPPNERLSWERRILNASCARWAVNAAAAIVALHWTFHSPPPTRASVKWEAIA